MFLIKIDDEHRLYGRTTTETYNNVSSSYHNVIVSTDIVLERASVEGIETKLSCQMKAAFEVLAMSLELNTNL